MKRRTERVAEAIRRLASEILHDQLKDPRLAGFITVTRVDVTADLRLAKIYYSTLGDDKRKKLVAQGLRSAKGFIRRHIADELKLRYAPDVTFVLDEEVEYSNRINTIIEKLKREEGNETDKNGRENNKSNKGKS